MNSPVEFAKSANLERVKDERWLTGAIEARDAEHRAELAELRKSYEDANARGGEANGRLQGQLREAEDANVMSAELIERLRGELGETDAALKLSREAVQAYCDSENAMRGELAEARAKLDSAERHVRRYHWDAVYSILVGSTPNEAAREQLAMGAPPPAESTPEPATPEGALRNVMAGRLPWQPAPPDNIRERLEESLINRIAEAKSYVLGQVGRVERVFAVHSEDAHRRLADHERRLAALEAKGEPGTHATTSQEQEGRCQGMVADRQCTQRNGHGGGCHHMYTEAAMWIAPTKEHRFVPQRRHRGIPIDLCDECAHAESHPCHPVGAKP